MKWLIPFLFLFTAAQADSITTGNLLPNVGDGVDWGSTSTEQINPGNSSGTVSNGTTLNGFDVTCPASQANCGYKYSVGGDFEVTGTATLSVDGIALTNNTRTQEMLDNGITLNSYIDVANCDSQPGNCEGKTGNADSHTVTIQLKDSSGDVLSTTTQTRTEIVGFQGNCNGYPGSNSGGQAANCGQYNDQVIYNNHGSNKVDWSWNGTDNNTGSSQRGGPNLLGAALTMTYDDTVLNQDASDSLDQVQDDLGDLDNQVFDDVQEFFFEEQFTFNEEPQFEMEIPMDMPMETFQFAEEFVEEFFMEIDQEFMMEPEGMELTNGPMVLFADDAIMDEMYEESNEIVATFLPMMIPEEEESFAQDEPPMFMPPPNEGPNTFQEEEMIEEPPMMTETFQQEEMIQEKPAMVTESFPQEEEMMEEEIIEEEMLEEPTEMAEEEMIEEEPTEMAEEESVEEKPAKMVQTKNEKKKEVKEKKLVSKTAKKSVVQTKKIKEQKAIQQKKALVKNLAKIMDKVDKDIKNISKNLAVKNIIKMQAMTGDQVSLNTYANTQFYKQKDIYLNQLNLIDNRLIYADKSLATYIQNDKMEIKARKLMEINSRKQQLLIELEVLKNG
jgi:hypothetical protein